MVIKTKHSAHHLMFHEPSGARTLCERDQYYIFDLRNSILDCKVVHACWKYELDPSQGEAEN